MYLHFLSGLDALTRHSLRVVITASLLCVALPLSANPPMPHDPQGFPPLGYDPELPERRFGGERPMPAWAERERPAPPEPRPWRHEPFPPAHSETAAPPPRWQGQDPRPPSWPEARPPVDQPAYGREAMPRERAQMPMPQAPQHDRWREDTARDPRPSWTPDATERERAYGPLPGSSASWRDERPREFSSGPRGYSEPRQAPEYHTPHWRYDAHRPESAPSYQGPQGRPADRPAYPGWPDYRQGHRSGPAYWPPYGPYGDYYPNTPYPGGAYGWPGSMLPWNYGNTPFGGFPFFSP